MKYLVEIKETEVYQLVVEADNEDEVMDVAFEKLEYGNKSDYHHDSDGEFSIIEHLKD